MHFKYIIYIYLVLYKKSIRFLQTKYRIKLPNILHFPERYSKYHWMNFLGNLLDFFFVFFILCVRRSIDVLDPNNQPGSGSGFIRTGSGSRALWHTEDVWHQEYENKKEGFQNYLEYSFNSILNIFNHSGYRALDPEFGQNRIHWIQWSYLSSVLKAVQLLHWVRFGQLC